MNSNTAETEGRPPSKTQNISRFHPRSSARPEDGLELPGGRDLKYKESLVHTPAGLRPSPNASRSAEFPLATIPKVVVTKSKSAAQDSGPSIESPLPVSPDVPPIPAWLLAETTIAFKAGAVVLFLLGALIAFKFGEHRGRKVALPEIKPLLAAGPAAVHAPAGFPEDLLPALDAALKMLRKGDNIGAREALNKMLASHPKAPSIHYAAAIAALQTGYPREADRLATTSIKNGFRVSDSWALKAAIAASLSKGATPDQETLLKKAIACDPMNPAPLIELASLLRYHGKNEAAVGLLESASFRLNPAEAQTVIETTKAILALDVAGELAPPSQPIGIPEKDIPNAFSEMKRGNFDNAAAILRFCRDQTPPDLFAYLVNDPALRKFTSRPELKEFY